MYICQLYIGQFWLQWDYFRNFAGFILFLNVNAYSSVNYFALHTKKNYVRVMFLTSLLILGWVPSDEFVFVHHFAPFMEKKFPGQKFLSFFRVQNYLGAVSLSADNLTKSEAWFIKDSNHLTFWWFGLIYQIFFTSWWRWRKWRMAICSVFEDWRIGKYYLTDLVGTLDFYPCFYQYAEIRK